MTRLKWLGASLTVLGLFLLVAFPYLELLGPPDDPIDDRPGIAITIFGSVYGIFLAASGLMIFRRRKRAFTMGLIASTLALAVFPIGTCIGVFGWISLPLERRFLTQ